MEQGTRGWARAWVEWNIQGKSADRSGSAEQRTPGRRGE
jgi:hypothetical protein